MNPPMLTLDVIHAMCRCDGSGQYVVCIDDICQGRGECMHGDGMAECPCGGDDYSDDEIGDTQ